MAFGDSIKSRVQVGDPAPDFTLPAHTGESVSLSDFLGKQCVVLSTPKTEPQDVPLKPVPSAMRTRCFSRQGPK